MRKVKKHGQEAVSPAQGEQMRQMKDLINHDYLVLKLRPGDPTAEVVHIMAHKLRGGIHITHIPSSDVTSVFHEGVHCFTVACRKKRIRLEALVAILKEEDPSYSLIFANCWSYAKNTCTAKRLVKACVDTPGISSAEKARLQKEHDNIGVTIAFRQFQSVAQSLLRNVVRNSSCVSDSSKTLMSCSSQVHELSSSPTDQSNSSEVRKSSISMDLLFSEPANPAGLNSFRAPNSSGWLDSLPRVAPELSSSFSANSCGKLCLQSGKLCLQNCGS